MMKVIMIKDNIEKRRKTQIAVTRRLNVTVVGYNPRTQQMKESASKLMEDGTIYQIALLWSYFLFSEDQIPPLNSLVI